MRLRTKKRHHLVFAMMVGAMLFLTGCGSERQENALAYRQIGLNALEEGDYETAVANFQLALDQSRGKITNLEEDICLQKAEALYLNGQLDDAIAVCDALIDYNKKLPNAYYLRGNLYLQKQEQEKALADYEQAAANADANYEIYIQLYENLNRAGMKDSGLEYLNRALKIKGKERYHLANQGYIYYLLGDVRQAQEKLLSAVEMEAKEGYDDKAELYLAKTYEKSGDANEAAKYYEAYAAKHADDSLVLEELGNMAMERQDYVNALAYYQKGLALKRPVNEQLLRRGEIAALEYMYDFTTAKEKMAQYVLDYPEDEQAARENLFLKTRTAVAEQIAEEMKQEAAKVQAEAEAEQEAGASPEAEEGN